jgi:stage V sporulation protein B
MAQRSFLHGAFVLISAALCTRIMGFAYRIFLTRYIGSEGMGLFQMVWPLLSLVLTFVTAGLPVAISKLVAEAFVRRDVVRIRRILRVSSVTIGVFAVVFTALMWVLRHWIRAHWITDPNAYPTYLAMIPLVAVISVASIFRGYFQGLQDMSPPAWASVIETIVRILSIWCLVVRFVPYGLPYAAAAAMIGTLCGEIAGLTWLVIMYVRRGRPAAVLPGAPVRSLESARKTLRAMAEVAVPVTLSRLIGSLMWAAEPVLVTRSLLRAGATVAQATMWYGQYGGMAIPLLVFPTVFTSALATNLVPAVSEAVAGSERGRVRIRVAQSWRAAAIVGFPASVLLTVYATSLCQAMYHEPEVGPLLAVMAPCGFLLYLQGPLAGVLQGLNRAGAAMRNSVIGGLVRLGLIVLLASNPDLGILGVAWATTISTCLTTVLHACTLYREIGLAVRVDDTTKIAVAALVMLACCTRLVPAEASVGGGRLAAAMAGGLLLDFVLLCSFRVITSQTVRRIPKIGGMLAKIVQAMPFAV